MALEQLREKLEDNAMAVKIGAGVLILLSLVFIVVNMAGGGGPSVQTQTTVIYYDVDQKVIKLVEHDTSAGPPSSPMNGTENVFIASVWYCDEGKDADVSDGMALADLEAEGLFIAWLEKADPAAKADEYNARPMMYRKLDSENWSKGETPAVMKIIESPLERCQDAAQYFVK